MAVEQFSIAVQGDFVAAQTRAKPIAALAELIWNGLDADATSIDVELVRDDLAGGLSRIVVYDNGEGVSRDDARKLFGSLVIRPCTRLRRGSGTCACGAGEAGSEPWARGHS